MNKHYETDYGGAAQAMMQRGQRNPEADETPFGSRTLGMNERKLGGRVNDRISELNGSIDRLTQSVSALTELLMEAGALTDATQKESGLAGGQAYSAPVSKLDARVLELVGRTDSLYSRVNEILRGLTL
jgi:hypothetical protein